MPDPTGWIAFAKLGRPHGLRGECRFFPYNAASAALDKIERVELRLGDRVVPARISGFRSSGGVLVASIDVIENRDDAEAWTGAEVFVPPTLFAPPGEGEYYSWELEGMKAVSPAGDALGTVRGLENYGAGDLLLVRVAGKEILLPFAEPWVGTIDREARTVVIEPADFLV